MYLAHIESNHVMLNTSTKQADVIANARWEFTFVVRIPLAVESYQHPCEATRVFHRSGMLGIRSPSFV